MPQNNDDRVRELEKRILQMEMAVEEERRKSARKLRTARWARFVFLLIIIAFAFLYLLYLQRIANLV